MSGNQQTRRRVSYNQLEALFEFLNAHREVAVRYNKSAQARQHSKEMWARAADLLSSAGDGAIKTGPRMVKGQFNLSPAIYDRGKPPGQEYPKPTSMYEKTNECEEARDVCQDRIVANGRKWSLPTPPLG